MVNFPHMPTPLISAGDLIKSSWQTFVKSWETMVRYSAWIILPSLLTLLIVLIPQGQDVMLGTFVALQVAFSLVVALWVSVSLYQVTFALDGGAKVSDQTTKNAWAFILPLLLIGLLQGLAVFGALLLLIIPGIYVGVRLGFSQVTLFSKNLRGRAALADSWALTKDRFWAVLWRQVAGGVVFGLLIMVVSLAAALIVGTVAGGAKLDALMASQKTGTLTGGLFELVQSIVQAAFIPLFVIFQVKLYKALDRTRA